MPSEKDNKEEEKKVESKSVQRRKAIQETDKDDDKSGHDSNKSGHVESENTDKKKQDKTVDKSVETVDKKDKIEVSKEDLTALMKRLDSLEENNKQLLAAADKSRMAAIREKNSANAPLIREVKLTKLSPTGPLVIAWKLLSNISYVEGNRLIEKQEIEVFYENGKSEKMPLINFYRNQNKLTVAEIVSRKKDEKSGIEMLEVELRDGQKLDIGLAFVN